MLAKFNNRVEIKNGTLQVEKVEPVFHYSWTDPETGEVFADQQGDFVKLYGIRARAAVYAIVDQALAETSKYRYHAHGAHLKFNPRHIPSDMDQAGYVSHEWAEAALLGKDFELKHGMWEVKIENFTPYLFRQPKLVAPQEGEAEYITADRRKIFAFRARNLLHDGYQLSLMPSISDKSDEQFTTEHSQAWLEEQMALAQMTDQAEARRIIREKIQRKVTAVAIGTLNHQPEKAARFAAKAGLVLTLQDANGNAIELSKGELLGRTVQPMTFGGSPFGAPVILHDDEILQRIAAFIGRGIKVQLI